jgi:hypothetical protein
VPLVCGFQVSPSVLCRIVPLSPTAHRDLPSPVPYTDKSPLVVPPDCGFQVSPSALCRIVPWSPTAHKALPSLLPYTDRRIFVVPVVCRLHVSPSVLCRISPFQPTAHKALPSPVPCTAMRFGHSTCHPYSIGAVVAVKGGVTVFQDSREQELRSRAVTAMTLELHLVEAITRAALLRRGPAIFLNILKETDLKRDRQVNANKQIANLLVSGSAGDILKKLTHEEIRRIIREVWISDEELKN